ncbi:hypothetical protein HYU90_01010 [Candidatus Collierbacteria bacterium]|nr:hypothetical protein [Candidatus Collierbacteria bacterium]
MTIETLKTESVKGQRKTFLHVHVGSRLDNMLRLNKEGDNPDLAVVYFHDKYFVVDLSIKSKDRRELISPETVDQWGDYYQTQIGHRVPEFRVEYLGNLNGFEYPVREIREDEVGNFSGPVIDITAQLKYPRIREAIERALFFLEG